MAGDLGSGRELSACGEVVRPAHEPGPGPHALLGELEPVVGRCEPVDERQDLAATRIDPQEPRRAVEPAVFEVGQQPVNPLAAGGERPADRVAGAHYSPQHAAAG